MLSEGMDIPVLIKNPVNPDIDLWIGAIERIHNAGIRRIGAIHRGFSSFDKKDLPQPAAMAHSYRTAPSAPKPTYHLRPKPYRRIDANW